jgi:hypothetical protein
MVSAEPSKRQVRTEAATGDPGHVGMTFNFEHWLKRKERVKITVLIQYK